MRPPLRVGIVVDALEVPAWAARVVRDIRESDVATLAAVIVAVPPSKAAPRRRRRLLFDLYTALDTRKFAPPTDALAPVNLAPLVEGVPSISVTCLETPDGEEIPQTEVTPLLTLGLDVAVCLRARPLRGDILRIAEHGVWWYHHGDLAAVRGGPPGFWEVMEGHPVTGVTLRVLADDLDRGSVLYRSYSTTHPLSVRLNQHNCFWQSSAFVGRKLAELYRDGPGALVDPEPLRAGAYVRRMYRPPGNFEMARLMARTAARGLARKVRDRTEYSQWALACSFGSPSPADKEPVPDLMLHRFKTLVPPADRFWADPFPAEVDGRHYVFLEEYPYAVGRGHIAVMAIGADGSVSPTVPVLERGYHLSYPFVFEWQGNHYMVPESAANSTVDLYRAVRFPYEWVWERTLIGDRQLVDATLVEIGGRWWMFANGPAVPDAPYDSAFWDELHLFYADSPLGPWTPHPRNPVISDVRRARPAGQLFQRAGVWYRPAQNCAGRYGRAFSIQRITRIDPERYEEMPVATLTASWSPEIERTHTVNAVGGLTVIDVALRRRRNPFVGGAARPR